MYTATNQGISFARKTSDGSVLWQSRYEGAHQNPGGTYLTGAPWSTRPGTRFRRKPLLLADRPPSRKGPHHVGGLLIVSR
jgi:hypothetical protein